ncbi:MAG: (2Fe-2S) ferredoxin domain-containing protein [Candidatus Sigynarchaeota archaeon]
MYQYLCMARVRVRVCVGTNCTFHGGQLISDRLESEPLFKGDIDVQVENVKCFDNLCADGKDSPVVEIDGAIYKRMSVEKVSEIVFSRISKRRE